jgi:hypothetical protein
MTETTKFHSSTVQVPSDPKPGEYARVGKFSKKLATALDAVNIPWKKTYHRRSPGQPQQDVYISVLNDGNLWDRALSVFDALDNAALGIGQPVDVPEGNLDGFAASATQSAVDEAPAPDPAPVEIAAPTSAEPAPASRPTYTYMTTGVTCDALTGYDLHIIQRRRAGRGETVLVKADPFTIETLRNVLVEKGIATERNKGRYFELKDTTQW